MEVFSYERLEEGKSTTFELSRYHPIGKLEGTFGMFVFERGDSTLDCPSLIHVKFVNVEPPEKVIPYLVSATHKNLVDYLAIFKVADLPR